LRKLLATIVASGLALSMMPGLGSASSAKPIVVVIDGEERIYESSPVNLNGTVLVPMRELFEDFGAVIQWDNKKKQVTAVKGSKTIRLILNSDKAYVGDREFPLITPAQSIDNKTMIPLRFVGEALDSDVKWEPKTQTVSITRKKLTEVEAADESQAIEAALNARYDAVYAKDIATWQKYYYKLDEKIKKQDEAWFSSSTYQYKMDTFKLVSLESKDAVAEIDLIVKNIDTFNGTPYISAIRKTKFKVTMTKIDDLWKIVRMEAMGPIETLSNPNPEEI